MRRRLLRTIRICSHCKSGFDAFRARDARGRYCSPECLIAARAAARHPRAAPKTAEP